MWEKPGLKKRIDFMAQVLIAPDGEVGRGDGSQFVLGVVRFSSLLISRLVNTARTTVSYFMSLEKEEVPPILIGKGVES